MSHTLVLFNQLNIVITLFVTEPDGCYANEVKSLFDQKL